MTDFTVEVASPPSYAVAPGDDGEYVVTMAEGATYEVAVSGGATTLGGLTDVTAPTPANGDGLVFNGTAWVNVDVATQAELNAHTGATGTAVHGLGTAATKDVPASGNASSSQVVKGDDTRLTDSRTDPTKVAKAGDTMTGTLNMTGNVALHQSYLSGTTDLYPSDFTLTYDDGTPAHYEQFYAYAGSVDLVTRTGTYGWRMRNNDVGNNQWRFILNADGTFAWGDGASASIDTDLYRDSAAVLRTDGEFRAAKIDGGTP